MLEQRNYYASYNITATSVTGSLVIEGSNDGLSWQTLGTASILAPGSAGVGGTFYGADLRLVVSISAVVSGTLTGSLTTKG